MFASSSDVWTLTLSFDSDDIRWNDGQAANCQLVMHMHVMTYERRGIRVGFAALNRCAMFSVRLRACPDAPHTS